MWTNLDTVDAGWEWKKNLGGEKNNKKENSTNYIVPSEAKRKTKIHSTQFAQLMKSIKLQRLSG